MKKFAVIICMLMFFTNAFADGLILDHGFYTDGSAPGNPLSEELIRVQFELLMPYADTLRFYGAAGELTKAYPIAKEMGFKVIGSAWLCGNGEADQAEMDALIEMCNAGYVDMAVVGSETLLRGDLTLDDLLAKIAYVREGIVDKTIPVTTADEISQWENNEALVNACDIVFPNCYPYWNGIDIDAAADWFIACVEALQACCPDKTIMISETGWPTEPSGQDALKYNEAVLQWSKSSGISVCLFSAIDEPWKATDEGTVGAHWGLFDSNLTLKPCYIDLTFLY